MAGDGNGDGGGIAARPGPRGSVERKRGSRRSLQAQRGVEGETVAAALRWHGCGCARAREGEQGERRRERVRGRSGLRGVVRGVPGDEEEAGGGQGKQEVEARRCACVGHAPSPCRGGRRQGRGGPGGLGRLLAGPACCCWAAQGRAPGKPLLSFIFVC